MFGRIKSAKPAAAVAVGVAAVLVLGGGSAVAKTFVTGADIKNGSLHMVDLSSAAQSALHGDRGAAGAAGATGATGAKGATGANGTTAAKGDTGATGAQGATGAPGAQGTTGAAGAEGDTGTPGADGAVGPKCDPGANAPAAQYGVATVNVKRGAGSASAWATYSTLLGSPVGDTTSGSFRFTCSDVNAPCTVAVKAAVLGTPGTVNVYPRVLIMRQDFNNGGPSSYCEYGDGSTGAAPVPITKQASSASPTYSAMKVNIGGSADCGIPGAPSGDVDQITVPSGYYDVHSSFVFLP
jgi:Collagen triple helix repeat (20 copies)